MTKMSLTLPTQCFNLCDMDKKTVYYYIAGVIFVLILLANVIIIGGMK